MPTAVALAGYNRPDYFRPTLRSLLSNAHLASCDLWCFFDGGPQSCQREYGRILQAELAGAEFAPRKVELVARPAKMGCGRNLIDIRRRLFDQEGYERVFVCEDDLVVGPHYLALCERLLDWALDRYADIGVVQSYNTCWLTKEEKVCRLDEVEVGNPHWWGYLMPRQTWNAIRESLYEYENRFLQVSDYEHRDASSISAWAMKRLAAKYKSVGGPAGVFGRERGFPRIWSFEKYFGGKFDTSQDSMTVLAMTLAGLQKLMTTVNRARPIGVTGLHSSVERFIEKRLNEITLDSFESDATRGAFRVPGPEEIFLPPLLRVDEIEAIRQVVRERQPRRVLEFGTGGSTVTLAREPSIRQWWSVEHSPTWLDRVLTATFAAGELNVKLVHCPECEILDRLDELLPLGFDMFFVDGYHRTAILDRLLEHLKVASGFVLLHDASREQYRETIERFGRRTVLTEGNGRHQGLVLLEL
jgi:predicted O-methyltransferase YrrM